MSGSPRPWMRLIPRFEPEGHFTDGTSPFPQGWLQRYMPEDLNTENGSSKAETIRDSEISVPSMPPKTDNVRVSSNGPMPNWNCDDTSNTIDVLFARDGASDASDENEIFASINHDETTYGASGGKSGSSPSSEALEIAKAEGSSMKSIVSTTGSHLEAVIANWSGRGAHVDFQSHEEVPLIQGLFLGHGSMGSVFKTTVNGYDFAWKRRFCRRKIGKAEWKEIEILKKLSHDHIIRLAGSYTHRQILGLLLWPVATCDLATFLEDYEAIMSNSPEDHARDERMVALGLIGEGVDAFKESTAVNFLACRMGCIVSAIEYLHSQRIRHKDLKPSNILLSADRVFLADFGTATDFSERSVSTTEGIERGTPKYFAPEVAAYEGSGRPADVFSLGCIFLEMLTITLWDSLESLRSLRTKHDKSFHANREAIVDWLQPTEWEDVVVYQIKVQINKMLKKDPADRPTIGQVRRDFALIDIHQAHHGRHQLFMGCCRNGYISRDAHERELKEAYSSGADNARVQTQETIDELSEEKQDLLKRVAELQQTLGQKQRSLDVLIRREAERIGTAAAEAPMDKLNKYTSRQPTIDRENSSHMLRRAPQV